MTDGDLKHYKQYKKRIGAYAQAVHIRIAYTHKETVYMPSVSRILIERGLDETEEIASLLHEFGHALDDACTDFLKYAFLARAYKAIYKDKYTPKQHRAVMACERRAWRYGRVIAGQLKIPLGKWYAEIQTDSLKTYRR